MPDDPRKMHWFRASKIANQAAHFTVARLAASKRLVVDTHERMLSEGSIPHELMVETLLAKALCAEASSQSLTTSVLASIRISGGSPAEGHKKSRRPEPAALTFPTED